MAKLLEIWAVDAGIFVKMFAADASKLGCDEK